MYHLAVSVVDTAAFAAPEVYADSLLRVPSHRRVDATLQREVMEVPSWVATHVPNESCKTERLK